MLKVLSGALFAGFVFPLWWAHQSTFDAARQIAGDPVLLGHSMPYETLSMDLATVGYIWLGCSMAWLFWHVTRRSQSLADRE